MTRASAIVLASALGAAPLLAAVALAAPPGAPVAPAPFVVEGDPVDVQADKMLVDLSQKTAQLDGKVTLRRGDLTVRCARIDARYDDAPRITWAHASGRVVVDYRGTHAEAGEAEIDLAKHVVDLRGSVSVTRAGARLSADAASIDLGTMRVALDGVHGVIAAPSSDAVATARPPSSAPVPP